MIAQLVRKWFYVFKSVKLSRDAPMEKEGFLIRCNNLSLIIIMKNEIWIGCLKEILSRLLSYKISYQVPGPMSLQKI